MAEHYQPKGVRFWDYASKREMLLVADDEERFSRWLCYKHPDGQWVSLRKATDAEVGAIRDMSVDAPAPLPSEPTKQE